MPREGGSPLLNLAVGTAPPTAGEGGLLRPSLVSAGSSKRQTLCVQPARRDYDRFRKRFGEPFDGPKDGADALYSGT